MHYRIAELSDLEAVLEGVLTLAEEQVEVGSRIVPRSSTSAFRDRLARRIVDGTVTVAEANAGVVGVVTYRLFRDELERDALVGLVEYLYVDPDHRGAGVGAELLSRAEAALADRGADTVELEVLAANDGARSFYRDCGYRPHRFRLAKDLATGDEH